MALLYNTGNGPTIQYRYFATDPPNFQLPHCDVASPTRRERQYHTILGNGRTIQYYYFATDPPTFGCHIAI